MFDLVLTHGTIVDPSRGRHEQTDVAFAKGRVAAIGPNLAAQAAKTVDCTGMLVTPGLVDLHIHAFPKASHYGKLPDSFCLNRGVTTAIDTGSAGADTFEATAPKIVAESKTRIRELLHISRIGMTSPPNMQEGQPNGELEKLEYADVDAAVAMAEKHPDIIVGIKIRMTAPMMAAENGIQPLFRAAEAAKRLGLPLMVHPQGARCDTLDDILAALRPGDIVTHCFHGSTCGVLDDSGKIRKAVWDAAERGILFDVGHGMASLDFDVAEKALAEGFAPHSISSDCHAHSVPEPAGDLVRTMSKFLAFGMSIEEVIAKATAAPARAVKLGDGIGSLIEDGVGDATVIEVEKGSFEFHDAMGKTRNGSELIVPRYTVRDGELYEAQPLS